MKLTRCIGKNMKILARSKGSALVVLLAPLLIVFIIGLGFMEDPELKLNIGVHERQPSDLTSRYIESFNTTEHNIIKYEQEEQCIKSISDGVTVLCAVFSENFEIKDDAKNEITFHVDESRINLVDRLISSFSTTLGVETSEITEELAQQLLRIIDVSNEEATKSLATIIQSRAQISTAKTETEKADDTITSLDTQTETINTNTLRTRADNVEEDLRKIRTEALDIISLAKKVDLTGDNGTDLKKAIEKLEQTIEDSEIIRDITVLQSAIRSVSSAAEKLTERIEDAGKVQTEVTKNLEALKEAIQKIEENTEIIKINQEKIISEIESFELRAARTISHPITTNTKSVASTNNRLTYSFSYLLTLAILFIGLMLSSTLVYMEKDSKAFFRNFTTPTTQKYFTFINYITALMIILIQTIIILVIAHYTLNVPILTNPLITTIFLILGITLFITLGLLIGLLAATSEAVTMSTIVIGSVFLFLSNLILPLETLSPIISKIANFNPYVIVSEGIRKAMLFEATIQETYPEMMMLVAYIVIIVTIMIVVNSLGLKHYLATRRHKKNVLIKEPENLVLEIKQEKRKIKNIPELIEALKTLKEQEYEELTKDENPISEWLRNNLKKRMLAIKIKKKKLPDTIKILEKYQKKKDKKIERKKRKETKKKTKK